MRTRFTRSSLPEPDVVDAARARACLDATALKNNYAVIRKQVPGQGVLPMIKANGYGHGAAWVARELLKEPDLIGFGVATLGEGARLREELGPRARRLSVVVFAAMSPFTEEKAQFCELHGLEPVLSTEDAWRAFHKGAWAERLKYHLEFETGMNRLGIPFAQAPVIAREVGKRPIEHRPESVFTHLASAEIPDGADCRKQLERYDSIRQAFRPASPGTRLHFANSAAIWNSQTYGVDERSDWVRPGISLYGVAPWRDAPLRGLQPVMELRASVVRCFALQAGEGVGYGATFRVPRGEKQSVAILAAGYADGVHRILSNQAGVWLNGRFERILGQISMDLMAVSASTQVKPGDEAVLLGPNVDIWALAKKAGTIPYELLTSVSSRVIRDG